MEVTTTVDGERGRTVVAVAGEVDIHTVDALRQALQAADASGAAVVAVDLADVTFMDSTGLGALVGALRRARERGSDLVLVAPQSRVRRLLAVTGLDAMLTVEDPAAP